MSGWSVYMLQCADATIYTGITNDLEQRLAAHQQGRAAKYTRARRPVELVYHESLADRSAALKREAEFKRLSRAEKLAIIGRPEDSRR